MIIAGLALAFATVATAKYLLSTDIEGMDAECLGHRLLRAVSLQALKIVVVVWQIVTQIRSSSTNYGQGCLVVQNACISK